MSERLHCLVCDRALDWAIEPDGESGLVQSPPSQATTFIAYGNYGSTVFDPFNYPEPREVLKLAVCDDCLKERQERVLLVRYRPRKQEVQSVRVWNGVDSEDEAMAAYSASQDQGEQPA